MKVAVVCLEVNRPGSWVQAAVTVQAWALLEDPTLAVPHQATECRLQTLASRDRCVSRAISTSREARQSGECSTRSGRAATCHVTAVSARHQFLLNQSSCWYSAASGVYCSSRTRCCECDACRCVCPLLPLATAIDVDSTCDAWRDVASCAWWRRGVVTAPRRDRDQAPCPAQRPRRRCRHQSHPPPDCYQQRRRGLRHQAAW